MGGFFLLLLSIGVAVDSSNLGYDKDDVPGFAPGPAGWFFFMLFLWFIALPIYLVKRPQLKAAAEQRRLRARTFAGALPGAVHPYGPQPNPYGGPPPYGAPGYGPPPPGYGAPPPAAPPYGAAPGANPYGAPPPSPYGAPTQGPAGANPAQSYSAPPQGPAGANPYGAPPQGPAGYPGPPPPANPYGAQQPSAAPPSPGATREPGATPASPPASEPGDHRSSSGSMTAGDLAEGIRKLTDLRDRGLLTEAEFQARKLALLDKV